MTTEGERMEALAVRETDRSQFIGGSDVAALLGLSPYKTPYMLWEEKVNGHEEERSREQMFHLNWGKRLEGVVIDWLAEEEGYDIVHRNRRYLDPEHEFMSCEIDFEYRDGEGWLCNGDVKTAGLFARGWGDEETDEIPPMYAVQFLYGQSITGAQMTMCSAAVGAKKPKNFFIPRDEEVIAWIRSETVRFWNDHVLARRPPAATNRADADFILEKLKGKTVRADDDLRAVLTELNEYTLREKNIKAHKAQLQDKVASELANRLGITSPEKEDAGFSILDEAGNILLTYNKQSRDGYSVAPTSFRVMRLKGKSNGRD